MHSALYVRAEMCAALPRRHQRAADQEPARPLGRRLPDRAHLHRMARAAATPIAPATPTSIPSFKRDCQSCHMQQDYGQPGTAQTLYQDGHPLPIPREARRHRRTSRARLHAPLRRRQRLVPRLIGKDVDAERQRRPLSRAVDLQLLVGRPQAAPIRAASGRNLDKQGAVRAAAAPRLGSPAQRPRP